MIKSYDGENVLLKLLYYCTQKKEVYFKRSNVTEYLISSSIFDIPNKQGFDGNLSYFGFDIKIDIDSERILLLRGKRINEKVLTGNLRIAKVGRRIDVEDDESEVFFEIDTLIANKTKEAKAFEDRKSVIRKYHLEECHYRLFGNKKIYKRDDKHYVFPHIVKDSISNTLLYEIVKSESIEKYDAQFIFPLYDSSGNHYNEKIIGYEELGDLETDFSYFQYRSDEDVLAEYEIQEISNERIIKLINKYEYDLTGKESTKKVLNNIRLNTGALRALALNRDHYKCALCNVNDPKLLVCSHIKPWKTGDGRLDLDNVITLCALHDALFDKGFFSFDSNGKIVYSNNKIFTEDPIKAFIETSRDHLELAISDKMRRYLEYHYQNVYKE